MNDRRSYSVTVPGITLAPSDQSEAGFFGRLALRLRRPRQPHKTTFTFTGFPPGAQVTMNGKPFVTIPGHDD